MSVRPSKEWTALLRKRDAEQQLLKERGAEARRNAQLDRKFGKPRRVFNALGIEIDYWGEHETKREPRVKRLNALDQAWADWISDFQRQGWEAHLLTFVFNHISNGQRARMSIMNDRLEEFYTKVGPFMVRHFNRTCNAGKRPIMIAVPEAKWGEILKSIGLAVSLPNESWHFHAVFLSPPTARNKPFDAFFAHNRRRFIYNDDVLRNVDVQPMDEQTRRVWGYINKTKSRNPDGQDEILVLPKPKREMVRNMDCFE